MKPPKALTLDLTGLSSPRLPDQITFKASPAVKVKTIRPHHLLKDGFTFSEEGDNVRRLMREHEAIMSARRPIMSAVTADHAWLKQQGLLVAAQRKEEEESREKEKYDLGNPSLYVLRMHSLPRVSFFLSRSLSFASPPAPSLRVSVGKSSPLSLLPVSENLYQTAGATPRSGLNVRTKASNWKKSNRWMTRWTQQSSLATMQISRRS